ncbi:flagellar hook-associated protein 2 [Pseudomonas sp. ok272]|uniref:flagellar filament capping protein FliD n=1 Tax=unclassified Pseudomonas TaxID=196821 RepID=UPI0008D60BCF|nr:MULTISPECIES: flagellar filament capping protein FliD [unclassified Pseudomonas]SEM63181.1 flagellar hook-associated protein 2 [Pseudomonas sp. ok272]SFM46869.1 flagellar hook-associated protein 2 [Pseudomonas sp. ok602]
MAIDSDYIKKMSTQLANYEVQAALAKANRNEANYKAQLTAVNSLDSSLKSFSSAIKSMKSAGSTMLINSATFSQEGVATAKVGTTAVPGNYQFFVEQLATRHQVSLGGLTAADLGSGSLNIGQDGKSFSVDLSKTATLDELAAAINNAADNSGVKATLVRSNGEVSLVLSSEKTGEANALSLSATGNTALDGALATKQELSKAQDAKVRLGGESGMLLTSASNTFENVIDGVSLTFNKVHKPGDQALSIDIGQDKTATKDKAQSFATALNTLMSTFDTLTASGGEDSTRGVLAGDSSIRAIENLLNQVVRNPYGGVSLMEFGISADRSGKLVLDATRFEKAVAANPEGFEKLFTGKDNLLESIEKNLSVYTSSANGLMKARKDSLNNQLRRVDEQFENIQKQYDSYYGRYLKQYTSMMQTMSAMEQTYGLF